METEYIFWHISDIHIRENSYQDLDYAFNQLSDHITRETSIQNQILVIAGDIFEYKNKFSGQDLKFFYSIIQKFRIPIVMIPGNHDFIPNPEYDNLINASLSVYQNKNLYLFQKSGVYILNQFPEIRFHILSPMDTQIPEETLKPGFNVLILHEMIKGTRINSRTNQTGRFSIPDLKKYNLVLAGDNHKFQLFPNGGYSGSLIPKNKHEGLEHGFIKWKVKLNPNPNLNLVNPEFIPLNLNQAYLIIRAQNDQLIIPEFQIKWNKLTGLDFKYQNCSQDKILEFETKIRAQFGIITNTIRSGSNFKDLNNTELENPKFDLSDLQFQLNLIMETLNQDPDLPLILDLHQTRYKSELVIKQKWKLRYLEWSNLYCFGENNWINFDNLTGTYSLIGNNGIGKSSLIDIITLALYKTTFRGELTDVINEETSSASLKCIFSIILDSKDSNKTEDYLIFRTLEKKNTKINQIKLYKKLWYENTWSELQSKTSESKSVENITNIYKIIHSLIGTQKLLLSVNIAPQYGSLIIDKIRNKSNSEDSKIGLIERYYGLDVLENIKKKIDEEIKDLKKNLDYSKKMLCFPDPNKLISQNPVPDLEKINLEELNQKKSSKKTLELEISKKIPEYQNLKLEYDKLNRNIGPDLNQFTIPKLLEKYKTEIEELRNSIIPDLNLEFINLEIKKNQIIHIPEPIPVEKPEKPQFPDPYLMELINNKNILNPKTLIPGINEIILSNPKITPGIGETRTKLILIELTKLKSELNLLESNLIPFNGPIPSKTKPVLEIEIKNIKLKLKELDSDLSLIQKLNIMENNSGLFDLFQKYKFELDFLKNLNQNLTPESENPKSENPALRNPESETLTRWIYFEPKTQSGTEIEKFRKIKSNLSEKKSKLESELKFSKLVFKYPEIFKKYPFSIQKNPTLLNQQPNSGKILIIKKRNSDLEFLKYILFKSEPKTETLEKIQKELSDLKNKPIIYKNYPGLLEIQKLLKSFSLRENISISKIQWEIQKFEENIKLIQEINNKNILDQLSQNPNCLNCDVNVLVFNDYLEFNSRVKIQFYQDQIQKLKTKYNFQISLLTEIVQVGVEKNQLELDYFQGYIYQNYPKLKNSEKKLKKINQFIKFLDQKLIDIDNFQKLTRIQKLENKITRIQFLSEQTFHKISSEIQTLTQILKKNKIHPKILESPENLETQLDLIKDQIDYQIKFKISKIEKLKQKLTYLEQAEQYFTNLEIKNQIENLKTKILYYENGYQWSLKAEKYNKFIDESKKHEENENKNKILIQEIQEISKNNQTIETQIQIKNKISLINQKIFDLKNLKIIFDQIEKIHPEILNKQEQIRKLEMDIQKYQEKLEIKKDYLEKSRELNLKLKYSEILHPKTGIPYKLLKNGIAPLENKINKILTEITNFNIKLNYEDSLNINMIPLNPEFSGTNTQLASGFQKFIIDFSFRLILAENHNSLPRFLLIDEGFGCMDKPHLRKTLDFLENFKVKNKFDWIIFISHIEDIHVVSDKNIKILREKKYQKEISKIVFGEYYNFNPELINQKVIMEIKSDNPNEIRNSEPDGKITCQICGKTYARSYKKHDISEFHKKALKKLELKK